MMLLVLPAAIAPSRQDGRRSSYRSAGILPARSTRRAGLLAGHANLGRWLERKSARNSILSVSALLLCGRRDLFHSITDLIPALKPLPGVRFDPGWASAFRHHRAIPRGSGVTNASTSASQTSARWWKPATKEDCVRKDNGH